MNIVKRMKGFEEHLTGGFEHGKLLMLESTENGQPSLDCVLFFMDAEYDPVRVTFDTDGLATIHADGHKWHVFTEEHLDMLATFSSDAPDFWYQWIEENPRKAADLGFNEPPTTSQDGPETPVKVGG